MILEDMRDLEVYADKVAIKAGQIIEAINWDDLPPEKKCVLLEKKAILFSEIERLYYLARKGGVVNPPEFDVHADSIMRDEVEFLKVVRQVFPYWDVRNTKICDIIYDEYERARMERERWLDVESKDSRYKCCENGHCFKNIEHDCRWCGTKEVIGRLDENTQILNRILYVGRREGKWIITTNPIIEGKSEQIRKITVDLVGKYKLYYHLDGKNPNPFCNNNIQLGDQSIKGKSLVQLCDKLIDEGLNEITIQL